MSPAYETGVTDLGDGARPRDERGEADRSVADRGDAARGVGDRGADDRRAPEAGVADIGNAARGVADRGDVLLGAGRLGVPLCDSGDLALVDCFDGVAGGVSSEGHPFVGVPRADSNSDWKDMSCRSLTAIQTVSISVHFLSATIMSALSNSSKLMNFGRSPLGTRFAKIMSASP